MTNAAPTAKPRSLPPGDWPQADRLAWERACSPGVRLRRGGGAAHLKPITRSDLARRYGYFLDHLGRKGALHSDGVPAGHVTPEKVAAYVAELQDRVGSVTVYGSIHKLRWSAELMAPRQDFSWLREIEKDLDAVKQARSKHPKVTTTVLVEAGLRLLKEAELASASRARTRRQLLREERRRARGVADRDTLHRAVLARNGLMIALLAYCSVRLKNFAALELERSFQKIGTSWWIILAPGEVKGGRADERPVPERLWPSIERYLAHHRLVLCRQRLPADKGPLWISAESGDGMPYMSVQLAFPRITFSTLGIAVSAHMFRTCAATTAAVCAPGMPGLASALLQHVDPRVTEQHYNRAAGHEAAQLYGAIVRRIQEGASDRS